MRKSNKIALAKLLILVCFSYDASACPQGPGGNNGGDAAGGPPQQQGAMAGNNAGGAPPPPPPQSAANTSNNSSSTPPGASPDMAQGGGNVSPNPVSAKTTREPASEPAPKIQVAPYVRKMWSCGCSNVRKICDKGFVFSSIAEATAYAKRVCGDTCVPSCTGRG